MRDVGFVLAIAGLSMWMAFVQTAAKLAVSKLSALLLVLALPLTIAALWRIALDLHWWTIAVFPVTGLVVGTFHAIAARKLGVSTIYSMQPLVGLMAALCVGASWFAR